MSAGYLVLASLTALSVLAALAVSVRINLQRRAEIAVATTMLWNLIIIAPIYVLGVTHHLDKRTLAFASCLTSLLILAVCFRGRQPRAFASELRHAIVGQLMMPIDGIREAVRQRSFVAFGLLLAGALIAWSALMSWYAPSYGQWDALWYHEPMIALAIQNRGFALVDLPPMLQKVNGYPRLCEMTQLWFVIFTDRRLIEVVNSLVAPSLVLSVFLLCSRYTKNRVHAMGWGAALLTLPFTSNLLQTVYVDTHNAAFILAGAYFASRKELRLRDGWIAAVCLALAVGSKHMALVPVGIFGAITLARLIMAHGRTRAGATALTIAGGLMMILAIASVTYLRNYLAYHNPLWPDFRYDNARFNIHWPGQVDWGAGGAQAGENLSMNLPASEFLDDLLRIPHSKDRSYYSQTYDYGFVVGWLLLPLSAVALLAVVVANVGSLLGARFRARAETTNILLLVLPALAIFYTSPALWSPRYLIAGVGLTMALIAWLGGRPGFDRLGEMAVTSTILCAFIMLFWPQHIRWWYTPAEAGVLSRTPYPEREVTPASLIGPTTYLGRGAAITRDAGLARESQLGRGSVLVFDENFGNFPALFWNNQFSNRVVYAPSTELLAKAKELDATWVYCTYSDPNRAALAAPGSGYEDLGQFNVENWGSIFRRVRSPMAAGVSPRSPADSVR